VLADGGVECFRGSTATGESRYHCIRAAAASERRVLPLDKVVADVSVSHQGLPAPARRSRSGLAVIGKGIITKAPLCRVWPGDGGRRWQSLEESGQRRVMADDRRHGMTRAMMCSGGWCWCLVPWLARCLVSGGGAGGQFPLAISASGGEAHVCLAQAASSSSPVSTSHQTQPVVDKTHLAPLLVSSKSKSSRPRALCTEAQAPGPVFTAHQQHHPLLPDCYSPISAFTTTVTYYHSATTITLFFPLPSLSIPTFNRYRHLTIALLIAPVAPSSAVFHPAPAFLARPGDDDT
jgi:hypothetical protein